jgi:hypothetical protein
MQSCLNGKHLCPLTLVLLEDHNFRLRCNQGWSCVLLLLPSAITPFTLAAANAALLAN